VESGSEGQSLGRRPFAVTEIGIVTCGPELSPIADGEPTKLRDLWAAGDFQSTSTTVLKVQSFSVVTASPPLSTAEQLVAPQQEMLLSGWLEIFLFDRLAHWLVVQ
jgi:hypothetical protein